MSPTVQLFLLNADPVLLVVDKPAGLASIAEGWERETPNLRALLEAEFGPVWTVHQLDKVTSGGRDEGQFAVQPFVQLFDQAGTGDESWSSGGDIKFGGEKLFHFWP